jgi:hypothetical protein
MRTPNASLKVFSVMIALAASTQAGAVDGDVLISQAKINAGGITPGDAPGFPATLSRPGRYKLSGNLTVPNGAVGIEVTQDDVVVDLNGFTISSNRPGQAMGGLFVRDGDRTWVANGTITGFQSYGVYLAGGAFAVVENMRIVSSGGPLYGAVYTGHQARIRNNTIVNSNSGGIVDCVECLVERNIITGSTHYGIGFRGGQVIDSVIADNKGLALSVSTLPDKAGYGGNILYRNNGGGPQVNGGYQLHPNVCSPNCP